MSMEQDIEWTYQDLAELESLIIAGLDTEALDLVRSMQSRLAVY